MSCAFQSCLTVATLWTVTRQATLSMEFFRQEYWSGLPFPSPGDLPNPGIKPGSPALQADSLPSEPPDKGVKLSIILKLSSHFKACERLVKSKRRICKILHFSLRKSTKDS